MAATGNTGSGNTGTARRNDAPQRRQLLRHMRDARAVQTGTQPPSQQAPQQAPQNPAPVRPQQPPQAARNAQVMALRLAQQKAAFTQSLVDAKPTLDKAVPLVQDKALPQALRDDFTQTRAHLMAASQGAQVGGFAAARGRLGEHKRAAVNLINARKAADLQAQQKQGQAQLHDEMGEVFARVKSGTFPEGQAAYIGALDLSAGKHFKEYLSKLAALEAEKAAAAKITAKGGVLGPVAIQQLRAACLALITAAQGHLDHHEADLSSSQKAEKSSQSKKRYCEEGLLAARQYLIALDYDALGDPRLSADGWDEATQIRAATVRAQLNYHQAYQAAASLKDSGDAAGMSDSLWLQGVDTELNTPTKPGATADWTRRQNRRVAIFKPFKGEKAPDGMHDQPGAGAVKEALASANAKLFAAQTGIDLGVPETQVVAINRYAVQGQGGGNAQEVVIGSAQANAGAKDQIADLSFAVRAKVKPRDIQKMAMLDLMQLNCDRHAGNIMVKFDAGGDPSLVPIDHGGSLPTRADFPAMKQRIGGISKGNFSTDIFNALLTMPGAYESFDPEIVAQLELLDPAAIEAGMKKQRAAMDKVHPDLGAGGKVPDDSFHLSKRSMMFMKRAARYLSPAEMQIALAQSGPALFDAPDDQFDTVADQVIADMAPKREPLKALLTGSKDELHEVLDWLEASGWVLGSGGSASTEFLMRDPALALKLFRAKAVNAQPATPKAVPPPPKEPDLKADAPDVSQDFMRQYKARFPAAKMDVEQKNWKLRAEVWRLAEAAGGATVYATILARTGADADDGVKDWYDSLLLWAELNTPANQALLAALQPRGAGRKASAVLRAHLKAGYADATGPATLAQAQAQGAQLDDGTLLKAAAEASLDRLQTLLKDPLLAKPLASVAGKMAAVQALLTQKDWTQAQGDAQALERDAERMALDALADVAKRETDAVLSRMIRPTPPHTVVTAIGDMTSACYTKASLNTAREGLDALRKALASLDKALKLLPAFDWDPKVASAAKKAAVQAGLFRDRDTGMSDALKAVAEAKKNFDDILGSKVKADKKRPVGEKTLAAYAKFIEFVDGKLRPLSDRVEWAHYCDGAVKAANDKISYVNGLMANWP